jgi:hypothetical protein
VPEIPAREISGRKPVRPVPYVVGTLVGILVGAAAGWYTAAVGLLVGLLVDQVLERLRYEKRLAAYLRSPEASVPIETNEGDSALAGIAFWLTSFDGGMTAKQADLLRSGLVPEGSLSDKVSRDARQLIDAVYEQRSVLDGPRLAASIATLPYAAKTERFRLLCDIAAADPAGYSENDAEAMEAVGDALGLKPSDLSSARIERDLALREAYRVLGLDLEADEAMAKAVFRKLAAQFHPDANTDLSEERRKRAEESFVKIDGAYKAVMRSINRIRG